MGIFSVTCDKCGNKVSKRARFCNACGAPTPGGWWKCPGCGKWIGNDVKYCSHCNTRLYPDERASIAGGVWQKDPATFAQRFEVGNLKLGEGQSLQVQEGTAAILMEAGEVTHVLGAGLHGLDGVLRKINWFGAPPPRSVVLIDAGEVIVPLHLENLRTAEYFPLEFYGEVILRFGGTKDDGKAFVANVLKEVREAPREDSTKPDSGQKSQQKLQPIETREFHFKDLAMRIEPLIRSAVDELCTTSTVEDLVRDPERRIRLRERMETRLAEELGACGLEIVRVSSAEFTGEEYEKWAEGQARLEETRREEEYRAALRAMLDKGKMGEMRDEKAMREYKADIDAEWRMSEAVREREFAQLKAEWAHDDTVAARLAELEALEHEEEKQRRSQEFRHETEDLEQEHLHGSEDRDQAHRHGLEDREVDHSVSTGRKMDAYEREKTVEDAKAAVTAQKLHSEQDVADADAWLGIKAKKQALALEAKAAEAARRKDMGIEHLLSDIEDPVAREHLIQLVHLKLQAGMTPQQILATLGQSDHDHGDEFLQKMEALYKDASDRADRNFSRIVDPLTVNVEGRISRGESSQKSDITRKSDSEYREDRHHQEETPAPHERKD